MNDCKIEISLVDGYCKNNCVWCYKNYIEKRMANVDHFINFVENNLNILPVPVITMSFGETLDHPEINKFFNFIEEKNGLTLPQFNTSLVTNNFEKKVDSMLFINSIVIEIGGCSNDSKLKNMGSSLDQFLYNLDILHNKVSKEKTNVQVKMMLNKNNYKEEDEFWSLSRKFNKFKFFLSSVQIFREEFIEHVCGFNNPQEERQNFIKRNFDENFDESNSTRTEEIYGDHFPNAWFLGSNNKVYMCFISSLLGDRYAIGDTADFVIKDFENTNSYIKRKELIRARNYTEVCSRYCNV